MNSTALDTSAAESNVPMVTEQVVAPRPTTPRGESLPLEWEFGAAMAGLAELMVSPVYYGIGVPRGDGHTVLILPGFMGSDSYLTVLAAWLARIGYQPALLGGGPSVGSVAALLEQAMRRTETLARRGQRLTLIGHSLGGILARLTASAHPERVAHVVTLGCSLTGDRRAGHPFVQRLSRALLSGDLDGLIAQRSLPLPANVRATSMYSRQDGVVDWRACVDPDPRTTNLVVTGGHVGLTWNAPVYRHLGRLLAG